jgi:hypothetical protein
VLNGVSAGARKRARVGHVLLEALFRLAELSDLAEQVVGNNLVGSRIAIVVDAKCVTRS